MFALHDNLIIIGSSKGFAIRSINAIHVPANFHIEPAIFESVFVAGFPCTAILVVVAVEQPLIQGLKKQHVYCRQVLMIAHYLQKRVK